MRTLGSVLIATMLAVVAMVGARPVPPAGQPDVGQAKPAAQREPGLYMTFETEN